MKQLLPAAAALLCAGGLSAFAQTNVFTPVTATGYTAAGVPLTSGSLTITPVDNGKQPMTIRTPDNQFYLKGVPALTAIITNGAIPSGLQVPDQCTARGVDSTQPVNMLVSIAGTAAGKPVSANFVSTAAVPIFCGSTAVALNAFAQPQTATVPGTGILALPSLPTHCTAPSVIYVTSAPYGTYSCVNGTPVAISGGSGSQGAQGVPGTAATVAVGTVTTGAAGTNATVTNAGTSSAAIFNFSIPRGAAGTNGTNGTGGSGSGLTTAQSTALYNTVSVFGRLGYSPTSALNLINPAGWLPGAVLSSDGSVQTNSNFYHTDYIYIGGASTVTSSSSSLIGCGAQGSAFYDASNAFVVDPNPPAGCPANAATYSRTVPTGAAYIRLSYPTYGNPIPAGTYVVTGTVAPTTPGYFALGASPWVGKRMALIGDSYSQSFGNVWQNGVALAHNMTITFQDVRANRPIGSANQSNSGPFECYNGDPVNGTNQQASKSPDGGGWGTCAAGGGAGQTANTGTAGNTLKQDLAAAAPDVIFAELGANDNNDTIGTIADSATTNSLYGYLKNAITGIINAAPLGTRVVWVEPPNVTARALQPICTAIQAVAAQYGVPVIRMFEESAINALNASSTLNSDGLHPSAVGWNQFYVPFIVRKLLQINPTN